ncbi:HlyD family efflux transporter periplasmic adaptor subunit [Chromobacterium vaccinii]|uniref:HlyD family efflux transporter periplasmic adaptor subunit n=1 Tax=Chromobacterium vaccinii TaxID=1108595 RepID=UPI001C92EA25|nr:HlyD family efflux transporter periplasmic adaptor subunit [Chromobacterium vaccinii]
MALAESSVERNSKLLEANFISIAGLQDKQAELLDQQTKLSDLKRSKVITMRERDEFVAELQDARIQMQRNDESSLREVNNIDQRLTENEAKRIFYVLAPKAGVISGIATQVGQKVNTGQILANLSPAGSPLGAELYATSKASGFIKPGMHVLIRYQAYPYQKFGQFHGLVKEVSLSPLTTGELITSTLKKAIQLSQYTESKSRLTIKLFSHMESLNH